MPYTHTCPQCGHAFTAKTKTRKFCSYACANASYSTRYNRNVTVCCAACGTEYRLPPSQAGGSRYCSKACYESMRNKPVDKTCAHCGARYTYAHFHRTRSRFCSRACASAAARTGVEKCCAQCGATYTARQNDRHRSRFCSDACFRASKRRQVERTCHNCGKVYSVQVHVARYNKYCSMVCKARDLRMFRGETRIERIIRELLTTLHLTFEQEYAIDRYFADFYLPAHRLVIECDGDYWHNLPDAQVQDRAKDAWLVANGYRVLRLPEHKIVHDLAWCRAEITTSLDP